MSIEIQKQMLKEIKHEIDNIDRILNNDGDKYDEYTIETLYKL